MKYFLILIVTTILGQNLLGQQQPLIKFYLNDNTLKSYSLTEIEDLEIYNSEFAFTLIVYISDNTLEKIDVSEINSIKFENNKTILIYCHDTIFSIKINQIDSITIQQVTPPNIQWQKCFGGSGHDGANSIIPSKEGGYIITGFTESKDGDINNNHGSYDYWVINFDSIGTLNWEKTIGGSSSDEANSIIESKDGGLVVAGYTESYDGDISGFHGLQDYFIIKLFSNGNIQWKKCLGGSRSEVANSITQCSDNGYIIAGFTDSKDRDIKGYHSGDEHFLFKDLWIVKLRPMGSIEWQKCLGGTGQEEGFSVLQSKDKGYLVAGFSDFNNGDVMGNHGWEDMWVTKLDSVGNLLWQKSLGGNWFDGAKSIISTIDGGFLIAGYSSSTEGDVTVNHGSGDFWIVKINSVGDIQWQKCFGGSFVDEAFDIKRTYDGGYIVVGISDSNDGNISGNNGKRDIWVVKLNSKGLIQWQKSLGGSDEDVAQSIQVTIDGGYIIAGTTKSNDGNVSGNHGGKDVWIIKLK